MGAYRLYDRYRMETFLMYLSLMMVIITFLHFLADLLVNRSASFTERMNLNS